MRKVLQSSLGGLGLIFLLAAVDAPALVTPEAAERALSAAEWLAEEAKAAGPETETPEAPGLTGWLLAAGGGRDGNGDAFAAYLGGLGYGDPLIAVTAWSEEMQALLQAAEAVDRGVRPIREIEAELESLPTVPLDAAGEAERQGLLDELALATYSPAERAAAAAVAPRIDRLRDLAHSAAGPGAN